jgi:hypothetical protein
MVIDDMVAIGLLSFCVWLLIAAIAVMWWPDQR